MHKTQYVYNVIRRIIKEERILNSDEDIEKALSLLKCIIDRIIKLEDDKLGAAIECAIFLRFLLLDFRQYGISLGLADFEMLFEAFFRLLNNDMVSKTVKLAIVDELLYLDEEVYGGWVGEEHADKIIQAVLRYDLWNDLWSDKFKRYLKRERDW